MSDAPARASSRLWLLPFAIPLFFLGAVLALVVDERLRDAEPAAGPDARRAPKAAFVLRLVVDDVEEPVHLAAPPGDEKRLFIVEKTGAVRIVRDGKLLERPFVALRDRVSRGSEQGLLSIAFHPRYAESGRFFLSFTDRRGDTRVVERRVSKDDPDRADPDFEREILFVDQPYSNHNGGLVVFGPDGMLWIGLGDGGSANDPHGAGQRLDTLFAKLLRVDVDRPGEGGAPYAIPPDNPFVGRAGARPEIWAYGLRNPWRFTFDRETGDLYIADVGQNKWEEVHVAPAASKGGENYGWNIMEGFHPFRRPRAEAISPPLPPVVEYSHSVGLSITGGHVYRGKDVPEIRGLYFYADYSTGVIRSFRWEGGEAKDHTDWSAVANPDGKSLWTSFGEDARGELYILSQEGQVYRFARPPV